MTTSSARYIVGIDLGTTNTALAFADTATNDVPRLELLPIAQVLTPGVVDQRPVLPSFLYLASPHDLPTGALDLPWASGRTFAVGELARARGAEVPSRLVASAKSWLCHGGVDRTASILPWGSGTDVPKVSPVVASARYLEHLAGAWDHLHADSPLATQEVYLAVPASFDAVARELTMEAARHAGLTNVTLLEEPQAAFYSWLAKNGDDWRRLLHVGDVVLVCDLGGGTTDFSLIAVADRDGELELERIAVGDHLLLGGDNMDLALSYAVAQKLAARGVKLDSWQQRALTHSCRLAKEQLLSDETMAKAPIAVLGRSSRVIGGTVRTDLERTEVESALLQGFFPACDLGASPQRSRRIGIQELGLPYAADAAVTRHLAEFISRRGRLPTAVLYNGGVMKGAVLQRRLGEVVRSWDSPAVRSSARQSGTQTGDLQRGALLKELSGTDLDLAVAHGAAYYGLVRRGQGIRIRGGAARAYYLGVETAMPAVPGVSPPLKALCVVPYGMEEGTEAELPAMELGLVVGEPAEFRFLGSTVRKDKLGDVVESWSSEPDEPDKPNDIEELAPLETVLPAGEGMTAGTSIPVRLRAHLTEVGTLELWCVARDGSRRWKLELNTREQREE
ncbi:MAG: Hsp70 family protein [Pseudomonadota bacterium]